MNIFYLNQLVEEVSKIDPENEILWEVNFNKRLDEMKKDMEKTIDYLNQCDEKGLFWATEVLEDLSNHFKSKKLIECVENNIKRCVDENTKKELEIVVEYMKKHV